MGPLDIWLYFLLVVLVSSAASCALMRRLPWNQAAREAYLDRFTGLALAPLLLGLCAILVLGFLPGASHGTHIIAIVSLLVGMTVIGRTGGQPLFPLRKLATLSDIEKTCVLLLCLIVLGLLTNALIIPLTQNDALEYATVGRELYAVRALNAYPLLNPETDVSGFYGPWTHPPLYVALIYVTHLLQGNADAPTLMRLIAPWCAIMCTGLVFALGNLVNFRTALLSSLVFLLTPLFFLGADSGLIDALPVLGSALMLAVLLGFTGKPTLVGALQGVVLGLTLWTHSQAILLIPLMIAGIALLYGVKHWRAALPQIIIMITITMVVASWPYLRNLELFGTLISDTPKVFALEQLGWKDYFAYNRGINTMTAKIQYGLFKGLSALEAYSLTFWVMLAGIVYYFTRVLPLRSVWSVWMDAREMPQPKAVYCAIFLVGAYLLGVLLSIIVDVDLMIRNERYMLMILPMAALIAGWFLHQVLSYMSQQKHGIMRSFIIYAIICGTLAYIGELGLFMVYRFSVNDINWSDMMKKNETILLQTSGYGSLKYLREETPEDTLVLSMRPADMYYAKRRMISYLDPRLVPFYSEKDPAKAVRLLKGLGIRYVQVSDYFLPPLYNSALMEILARPDLSSLVFDNIDPDNFSRGQLYQKRLVINMLRKNQFNHIYELTPEKSTTAGGRINFAQPHYPWIEFKSWVIGGRKPFLNIMNITRDFKGPVSKLDLPLKLFQRGRLNTIAVGSLELMDGMNIPKDLIRISDQKEYVADIELKGEGNVAFWIIQYDANGQALRYDRTHIGGEKVLIGDYVLSKTAPQKRFLRRIPTLPEAHYLQVGIEHAGNSWIKVIRAELIAYQQRR